MGGAYIRGNRSSIGSHVAALLVAAGALLHAGGPLAESIVEVQGEGAFAHVRAFQEIATANGGNRAAGTPGYDRSADYVTERLRSAGYMVRFEEFTVPFFEERSPPIIATGSPGRELMPLPIGAIRTLANSGSGEVSARLQAVDLALADGAPPGPSTSGCEASDFESFERGAIALLRRGTCPFQVKIENATGAGAAGVIIMNEGTNERTSTFSGRLMRLASVPVVGIAFEPGRLLASAVGKGDIFLVRLKVDAEVGSRMTRNVLVDREGDPARMIVVGAHLDSVREAPGMNDNASGSAAVLEAALRLAETHSSSGPRIRFAFWGAEEMGLFGSRHHVDSLSEEERRAIVLYINLDMVGSPNFGRFVQSAQESSDGPAVTAQRALLAYFRDRNLPVEERVRAGRSGFGSDDASFAEKGIPTVGLYTGAGETKHDAHAALFGGSAGQPFDPCYHKACDTTNNINRRVLEEMSAVLSHALMELGRG
jgi:Zn-dependent M28 family amino/carboxypeptidase